MSQRFCFLHPRGRIRRPRCIVAPFSARKRQMYVETKCGTERKSTASYSTQTKRWNESSLAVLACAFGRLCCSPHCFTVSDVNNLSFHVFMIIFITELCVRNVLVLYVAAKSTVSVTFMSETVRITKNAFRISFPLASLFVECTSHFTVPGRTLLHYPILFIDRSILQ